MHRYLISVCIVFMGAFNCLSAMNDNNHNKHVYKSHRDLNYKKPIFEQPVFKIPLRDQYIQHIKNGNKTVEGRINKGVFKAIKPNSIIEFFSNSSTVKVRVNSINKYNSFQDMLSTEQISKMLPEMEDGKDIQKAVTLYRSFPGYRDQEIIHGVVAVHLSCVHKKF